MTTLATTRIDTRPNIQERAFRGVQRLGAKTVHAIQTETVWRRLAYCGKAVENASGSRKPVSCPDCLASLREVGYSG